MLLTSSLCPTLILLTLCVTIINCTIQVVNINTGYCVINDQSCVKNSSCVDTINPGFGW